MKIAIIGLGFVGNALLNALKGDVEVAKIDPKLKTSIKDLKAFNPQITFISVPTPMNKDLQDLSILNNVIEEIKLLKIKTLVVLKSTVIPTQVESIEKELEKFVYNPEFWAREVRRYLIDNIEDEIAEKIINNRSKKTFKIELNKDQIIIK